MLEKKRYRCYNSSRGDVPCVLRFAAETFFCRKIKYNPPRIFGISAERELN